MICKDPLVTNQTLSFFAGECKWYEQTQILPRLLLPLALERARMQIPSGSHLLGDNSTNDSSVDKAGPFVTLLPDLIQSSARENLMSPALSPAHRGCQPRTSADPPMLSRGAELFPFARHINLGWIWVTQAWVASSIISSRFDPT